MKNLDVMYSSKSDEWATPKDFFKSLDEEFHFDLDAAASHINHKCNKYFTIEDDGLTQNWGGVEYSATHHIARLKSGLKRLFMRLSKKTL